jgi:hypothetical protein
MGWGRSMEEKIIVREDIGRRKLKINSFKTDKNKKNKLRGP